MRRLRTRIFPVLLAASFFTVAGVTNAQHGDYGVVSYPAGNASSTHPADPALPSPASAGVSLRLDPDLSEARPASTAGRPVYGSGDRISGRVDRDVTFSGNASLRQAGTMIRADRLTWYPDDDQLLAVGRVRVTYKGNVFTGPELALKLDDDTGWFESPGYFLPDYDGRGQAARIDFLGSDRMRLIEASYTTCRFDDPDWVLHTATMTLDQEREEGRGRSASLYFKGVKILAVPAFAFPLGDRRRSGFLAPSMSITSRSGTEVTIPWYWNIAPNQDMTLYPRVSLRRGVQLGAEYRYLQPSYRGTVAAEWNPDDPVAHRGRYLYEWRNDFSGWAGWYGGWNVRGVSDDNYFVDFGRSIVSSSERLLPRIFTASRLLPGDWTATVSVDTWQSILDARPGPYERVPHLQLRNFVRNAGGFDFDTALEATRFRAPTVGLPEGWRSVANLQLSYPVVRPGWFISPKMQLHLSNYQIEAGADGFVDRTRSSTVPVFSIDGGLVFERPARFFGQEVTQTLEPRLFYVRIPYRDQSGLPVYDTTPADFNFAQLFSENTFVGHDRIADANQLTAAVVSRFVDPHSGVERFRFSIGQRIHFSQQRVTLPGVQPRTDERSDILVAASGELARYQSFDAGFQYSVRDHDVPRYTALWRYLPPDGRILNVGLRFRRNEIGQFDTSWRWPIDRDWMALGRLNYSFLGSGRDPISGVPNERGVIESVLGFEYDACCWATRVVAQRFRTAVGRSTTAFFIQLELKGLGRLGSDPFGILRRNIPGYRLPAERPAMPSRYSGYE